MTTISSARRLPGGRSRAASGPRPRVTRQVASASSARIADASESAWRNSPWVVSRSRRTARRSASSGMVDDDETLGIGAHAIASGAMDEPRAQRRAQGARPRSRRHARARARRSVPRDHGELVQRDTYFGAPRGALKLREQTPGRRELIAYGRADEAAARTSRATGSSAAPAPDALRDGARRRARASRASSRSGAGCCCGRACGSTSTTSTAWAPSSSSRRWPRSRSRTERASKVAELRERARDRRREPASPAAYSDLLLDGRASCCSTPRATAMRHALRALLALPGRRGAARRRRRASTPARTSRTPPTRRASARRHRRSGRWSPAAASRDRGGRGGRAERRPLPALRRLPPAAARVRRRRHAGPPRPTSTGRPRRSASCCRCRSAPRTLA